MGLYAVYFFQGNFHMSLLACTNGVLLTDTIGIDCSTNDKKRFKMKKLFLSSDNRFALAGTGDMIPSFYWPKVESLIRRLLDVYYKNGGDDMSLAGLDLADTKLVKNLINSRQLVIMTKDAVFHAEDDGMSFTRFEHLIVQGTYSNNFLIAAEFKAMETNRFLEDLSTSEIVDAAYYGVSYASSIPPKYKVDSNDPRFFEIDYVEQSRMNGYTDNWEK